MRTMLAVLLLIASSSSFAGEKTRLERYLESLPPMDAKVRTAFDKAALSMYRDDCQCLTFWFEGKIREADLPLDDADRWLLIDGIKSGSIKPFGPQGHGS